MVNNVDDIDKLLKPYTNETTINGLYEYVNDYVCIRTRYNDENSIYLSVRIFKDYEYLKGQKNTINSNNYAGKPEIKEILERLENKIKFYFDVEENIEFEYRRIIDGGSVKYKYNIPKK